MLNDKKKQAMRDYEKSRQAELKRLRAGYPTMTREEKIVEVKRVREQVRKRVERLLPLEKEFGSIPALEAIEQNRRGYSVFDEERRKIAIKDDKGRTIPINKLTDAQLDMILEQGTKWLTTKTSQVSGAKSNILKRTRETMTALSEMFDSELIDDFEKNIGDDKYVMEVATQMGKFWDTIREIRNLEDKAIADKILRPDEYNEVFEEVMSLISDEINNAKTPKELAELLSSKLKKKAEDLSRMRQEEAEELVRQTGGRLTEDITRMRGGFRGNREK